MKTRFLVSIYLIFFCYALQAQKEERLDSLLNIYENQPDGIEKIETLDQLYYGTFHLKRPEDVLPYVKEQLQLSKTFNYKKGEGDALFNYGNYYRRIYAFDSAHYYFEQAVSIWEELDDNEGKFKTFNGLAKIEQLQGNFTKSLELYEKVMETAKNMKSGIRIAETNREIATIYMDKASYEIGVKYMLNGLRGLDSLEKPYLEKRADMLVGVGRIESLRGNDEAALSPLLEGLKIFEEQGNPLWQCITHTEIGYAYLGLDEIDKGIEHFNKSLEISISSGRKGFEAICYHNLGLANRKKGNLELAEDFLNKSIALGKTTANNNVSSYNELGSLFLEKNQMADAIENHTKAIHLADSIESLAELKDGYEGRSLAYEKSGQFQNALEDQKKFISLNDSIFNTTKSQQIEELRTIYETEKKEQQIALLEQEAKVNQLEKMLLGGGLGLSVLVFGFGFYGVRQKLKRNKLEKEKVDAELAFKKKELTTHALHLAKKNEVLEGLKQKAEELKHNEDSKKGYQQLIRTINFDLQDDNNWENFSRYFEEVHKDFNSNVKSKYPQVTSNELRLLSLLKMNLSSKEIANILNISPEGIKKARYRLRKKLDITTEDSLQDLVLSL
ncbi:tetratricopeptide repeat protein [Muricauda sp. CAU 1633]|uniref:tetratricopeptide repeat protein n=1 Tax=Allomuricauda sp. CAU 1633 TaxID=2816036 RepID=UPI001A8D704F|nr:tetratricopeptide repeat protein [Muricauda sp. CAU 1633]MBO0324027.1 tetratricopeptide repeat protein [Muricauda sp. CAU 1633]